MKILQNNPVYNIYSLNPRKQEKLDSQNRISQLSAIPCFRAIQHISPNKLSPKNKDYIASLIQNYNFDNEFISFLGKGTFGTAYRILLPLLGDIAVKILNDDKSNMVYGGGNLAKEAEILDKMPRECTRTQQLIDFFSLGGIDYLVSTFIKGEPLSKQTNISSQLIYNIVDELYKYDKNGLMFYDLNPNNIKVHNNNAGFFDFEFMEKNDINNPNFSALNDLHHVDRNLFFPRKSNLNSFENRSLAKIIEKDDSDLLIKSYLQALSKYYSNRAELYSGQAADYDRELAKLYNEPDERILSIEKELIALRSFTLNYYLYLHRVRNNGLIDGDIENYADFDKYIRSINAKAISIKNKLTQNTQYDKVTDLYIDSLMKLNCSRGSFAAKKHNQIMELKNLKDKIISSNSREKLPDFEVLYKQTSELYQDNPELYEFCNNIRHVLYKTLDFLSS